MRVVHSVQYWLPPTENWIYRQVRHLENEEVESHVVCRRCIRPDRFPHPRLHPLASAGLLTRARDLFLTRLGVRRHLEHLVDVARCAGAEVLHSHFGNHGWENVRAARRLALKHVVSFYGQDACRLPRISSGWAGRYRDLFASADAFLCEGPCLASRLIDLGCPRDKVRVHPLGVDVDEIPFHPRRWSEGETLRVLMAATFREKKGIPLGLEALARLRNELDLEITLIGDAGSDRRSRAEREEVLQTIERLALSRSVRRIGYVAPEILVSEALDHHVFLAPSLTASDGDSEGGAPVVLIELAATGMPVVSTRHADIPFVIEHGVTGRLAPERDAAGLAAEIRELLSAPEGWEEIAKRARVDIERRFHAGRQAQDLARIYREVVGCPAHATSA